MNTLTTLNTSLLVVGIAGVTAAIELAKSGMIPEAIIAGITGLVVIYLYEKLPASNP